MKQKPAILVLEDGTYYKAWSLSHSYTITGEVIFNTGITGYQEILTDPSYFGQIIVFTYPEIGNTGINNEDNESVKIQCSGIIAKNLSASPSNWRMKSSVIKVVEANQVPNLYGLDTRKLTQHLRISGSMNGCLSNEILDPKELLAKIIKTPPMSGLDLVQKVTTSESYTWYESSLQKWNFNHKLNQVEKSSRKIVIVLDLGVKYNILRHLKNYGFDVIVMSASTSVEDILAYNPSGIMLSNGPGDPSAVTYAVKTIKNLIQHRIPIFGICMGHQLLCIALGAETFKLKFGHRGINHPTGVFQKVEITSQNHGFAVSTKRLEEDNIKITHYNLNDFTLAGIAHKQLPLFSVQYHPEASPGPHDADFLFSIFAKIINNRI
uniref:carbamoyl-phosphate synthase arginine-specific small subunit n=1 Tax=Rhodaphanes brevistipitata TaxID=446136 RepID=UPI001FCCC161|nr:carbamoyl-phosphate synthase arginine-specific small subunit [Rhodaphanes brevistipitata]UNJ18423.1 carbamoyl-phosphate synthase arginine-specific small subunit [Rhodaphanes brevistipitata]